MGTGTLVHSLGSMNLSPMIRLDIASFFLCLIANGRMFFIPAKPILYLPSTQPSPHVCLLTLRPLCQRRRGSYVGCVMGLISFSLIFLPLFRHLTLSMSDAACGSGGVFYTPENIMFSESISKCKNSRYVLNK